MLDSHLNFKDIILRHKKSIVNSRSECMISTTLGCMRFAAPVCCSNMKSVLTKDICKIFNDREWFYVYHRIDGIEDVRQLVVTANLEKWRCISISVGIGEDWIEFVKYLKWHNYRIDFFTVDVALSYNDNIVPIVDKIKELFPKSYLIVGNGCTAEWIKFLEELGVDCAKVGIGVSKSCKTRQYTGFGSSTVSSLLECVSAANNIQIMSDGGLTVDDQGDVWIGDINKALALNSDFVMSGAAFSKCINSPAVLNGYYGNASEDAKGHTKHIEGTNVKIVTNGLTISQMCDLIEDSIRSGVSYAGGKDLSAFKSVGINTIR